MTDFAVWAPQRAGSGCRSTASRTPMTPRRRRAGGAPTWPAPARHRLRLPARRRPDRRCPTRARCRQPDGVHGRVAALRPRRVPLDRPVVDRPAAARQRALRAARRHVHRRRAPSTRRSGGSTTWSSSASTWSRCCRSTPSTARATGATTASAGTRSPRTTAARTGSSGSSTPATARAWAWCSTSSTTTSARPAPTSTAFGPYFAGSNIWGPSVNLDGPHSDEVRRYVIDNALMWLRDYHVDGLRLDAVHALRDTRATHLLEELAVEVEALSAHLGRPLSLIAESDLNDPRLVTAARGRRLRPARAVVRRRPPRLHAALTGERQGYYADFATAGLTGLAHVLTRAFLHAGTWSSFRQRNHGAPGRHPAHPRPPVRRLPAEPRPDRQPGHRRPAHRDPLPRAAGLRGGAAAHLAVHPDAVHGRGVGRAHAVAVLLALPRRGRCATPCATGGTAEFAEHGWGDADVPDPNAEPRSTTPSSTGPSGSRSRTPRCCACTAS